MGLSLAKLLISPQKVGVISKVYYFDFLVSCLHTFNPLSLSLKWVMTVVATTYRNMESRQSVWSKYFELSKESKQNWTTELRNLFLCNFWLLLPKPFLEGRLGTRFCLHPIWDFSNTLLFPKILSLKSFGR